MDTICDVCRHPAPEDRYLCEACEYQLHTWLRTLPRQAELLRLCLHPATGPAQRGGSGRAHSPLPVDLRVLDLLGPGHAVPLEDPHGDQTGGIPITALLAGWAHYIAGSIPAADRAAYGAVRVDPYGRPCAWLQAGTGIAAWCTWLRTSLPYAVTRPLVSDLYSQLDALVARIGLITHTTPRRTPKDAPCPSCTSFALVEWEDQLHITCEACGHRLLPDEYTAHRGQVMPALARVALLMEARREEARREDAA